MKKRLLSLLLAITMLATLLPAIPLAGAADGYTFLYDLNYNKVLNADKISIADVDAWGSSYSASHNMWKYLSSTTIGRTGLFAYSFGDKSYGLQIQPGGISGKWLALELNIPVAGEYSVTYRHGVHKVGGLGEIYLLPPGVTDIATAINTDTYKLNSQSIDYCQKNTSAKGGFYVKPEKKVVVTEETVGKYTLVIASSAYNPDYPGSNYANMYPCTFTLSSGSDALPMELNASFDEVLSVGTSGTIALSGYMSDGTSLNSDKIGALSCVSKNPEIATVDNTGKITGVSAGEAVIEVSATTAGITLKDEVTVTVDEVMLADGNTFIYDLNPDLTKDVLLSSMTIEDTRGMWLWADATATLEKTDTHTVSGVEANNSNNGDWFAVKINVPVAGKYVAELVHGVSRSSGGFGTVYLLPGNVDIAGVIDSAATLGSEVSYYNPDKGLSGVVTPLGTTNITEPGEYYLVFRTTRKGDGYQNHPSYENGFAANNRMYPYKFILKNGENAVPMLVKASCDMESIRINEACKLSVSAFLSNGTKADGATDDVELTYKSKNENVAAVDENGEVMGVSAGEAEIEVSVTSNGVTKTGIAKVTVTDEVLKFSDYTLMYDFTFDMKKITNVVWADINETHTRNFWMPHSIMPGIVITTLRKTSYGLQIGTSAKQFVVLELNVPVGGVYKTEMGYAQGASGGEAAMYIVDADTEDIAAALPAAQKVGNVNCYAASFVDNLYKAGNNIEIKKPGKYLLVINAESAGDGNGNGKSANMYIKSLKLIGGEEKAIESIFLSKNETELIIGDSDKVSVTDAYLSDCTKADASDYMVEYLSSDDAVATVDAEGNIKAIASGDAVITVTAKRGDSVVTRNMKVAVLPETYSGYTAKYNLVKTENFSETTYKDTNNLWSFNAANVQVASDENSVSFGTDESSEASIKVIVPVSGEYQVRVSHKQAENGAVGSVYVDGEKVGVVDYSTPDAETKLSVLNLSTGEHTIAFKYDSGSGFVQSPSTVTLYGGKKLAAMDAELVFAYNTASVTKAWLSDGSEVSASDVVVRYRIESDADIAIDIESGKVDAAVEDAEAKVFAEVYHDDVAALKTIDVTVIGVKESEYTLVYDFREADVADGIPLKGIEYETTNGFWKYHSAKVESAGIKTASYGFYLTLAKGNWAALKIYVPAPGRYTTRLDHLAGTTGGIGEIHILPGDTEDIDAAMNSGMSQNLGSANFFNDGSSIYPQTTLQDVTFFEKGEYILVFRSVEQGGLGSANIYPQQIVFNAVKENSTIQSVFVKDYELCINEDVSVKPEKIFMTDYSAAQFGTYDLDVVSSNTDIVSVDGNLITGVSEGEATLDIIASIDNVSEVRRSKVVVLSAGSSGYTFNYNFVNTTASDYKTSKYEDTYNFWQFANTDAENIAVSGNSVKFDGTYVAYEINVPVKGKYRANVAYANAADGAAGSVYVGKSINEATKVGSIDYTSGTLTSIDELEFEAPGKYYVIFKNENGDSKMQYPSSLKLVGGSKKMLVGVKVIADGNGAKVDSGIMSDGNVVDLDNATVEFSLENLEAGCIDARTGKITPSEIGGKSRVYASVLYDGVLASGVAKIDIASGVYELSGVTTQYRFNERTADWMSPYGTNAYDIRKITREYNDGNWAWWGVSPKLNVDGRPSLCYAYPGSESVPRLRLITYQDEWVAFEIDVPAPGAYCATLDSAKSNRSNSGETDIFILPLEDNATSESVDAALDNSTFVGRVSFYDDSVAESKWIVTATDNLGVVTFEKAGKHLVVFKQNKTDIAKELTMKSLSLTGSANVLANADFSLEKTVYEVGETGTSEFCAFLLDGTALNSEDAGVVYSSDDETVATFEDGIVTAVGKGTTTLTLNVIYNGQSVKVSRTVIVNDNTGTAGIVLSTDDWGFVEEEIELKVQRRYNSGSLVDIGNIPVIYTVTDGDASIVKGSYIKASSVGNVTVVASVKLDGTVYTSEPFVIEIRERTQKSEPTYYTYARREAAQKNMNTYDWAKTGLEQTIGYADDYLEKYEYVYDHLTGEGLPRSQRVGEVNDPEYKKCRYCGTDTVTKYGSGATGGYSVNIYNNKWKIQCKECKRFFPSNDFGLFYERGLDEYGIFNRERAYANNAEAVANGEKDALKNDLYPELWKEDSALYNTDPLGKAITWNDENGGADLGMVTDPSTGEEIIGGRMWGVDDGLGYLPGRAYANGCTERHSYVAYYVHKLWEEFNYNIRWLSRGYVYTGDERYGRAGAILLDRLSDLYPTFAQKQWEKRFLVSDGGSGFGKIFGCINDCEYVTMWAQDADAFYPIIQNNDPKVIEFLSKKQREYGFRSMTGNPKTSGDKIWSNVEDGLLREIYTSIQEGNICGNYGQAQKALASVALVLDNQPESNDIVEYLYRPGARVISGSTAHCDGGNLSVQFIDVIDRDGMGNEAAPNYNLGWIADLYECADMLNMYTDDPKYDLYQNPKYAKMFTAAIPVVLTDDHTAQIGDTSWTASVEISGAQDLMIKGFKELKDTSLGNELAEFIYRRNGYTEKGLHYDYFDPDPNSLQKDILERIDDDLVQKSEMMPSYGFAVLREGAKYGSDHMPTYTNNMRDFWLYFGRNAGHGHWDTLNLGIEAFGLNMAPDNGTPEVKSNDPNRYQWVEPTIAHNTVVVNEKNQDDVGLHGYPKHFDDAGDVKVMDIDASKAYKVASIYRRTLVMVNAGDDVSYGVDFFRVKGGNDHIYSFHSQSEEIFETEGLGEITYQTDDGTATGNYIGSYAGADVKFGPDPCDTYIESQYIYPHGYTWMKNIRKAKDVNKFAVDFKITDYRKVLKDSSGLHLRMTMLNDFELQEVALTSGYVIRTAGTAPLPETFEYVLARRKGNTLDSLFTTVYEPYRHERYISDMSAVDGIEILDGSEKNDDEIKVVKVVRTDGRVDYVVYATNNQVLYKITDGDVVFNFRGFVGVYSINAEGKNIYNYIHDGDAIGQISNVKTAYTGVVAEFTKDLAFENSITIKTNDTVDVDALSDKYIFIENDTTQNAVYKIESAEKVDGGIKVNIGATTTIRSLKDSSDLSKGYIFNIANGQKVNIPLSNVDDNGPIFETTADVTTSVGKSVTTTVKAIASDDAAVVYSGATLPRGATIDSETGVITWKPTASQIGNNHFAILARDEYGRESTLHFIITVYGSTTGGSGGGGGGASAPATPSTPTTPESPTTPTDKPEDEPQTPSVPSVPSTDGDTRFVDLGNHAWAADAINALADDGIIKGTSATTFSPAANITRADFAILLVRAFKLESENEENFADVNASDYFAKELAVARNTGIVGGIGDNKYAPKNNITRQDMMVIVYRALEKMGKISVGEDIILPQNPDFATVSDYAKEAVSALISAGLVNGKNGNIAPKDYTTRAEVAVLIKRILDYINK